MLLGKCKWTRTLLENVSMSMLAWPLLLSIASIKFSSFTLDQLWNQHGKKVYQKDTVGVADSIQVRERWCGWAAHWSLRFCWSRACADVPSEATFSAWTGMNLKYLQRLSYQWQFAQYDLHSCRSVLRLPLVLLSAYMLEASWRFVMWTGSSF